MFRHMSTRGSSMSSSRGFRSVSHDLPPPPAPLTARTSFNRFLHFGWWWEVSSIFVATICTCLSMTVLFYTDGKALTEWKLPIQPNSLIAIFSTIAKSALLVPIAEGLSQLKWTYFEVPEPRELAQMQVFDDASRGPWGALVFLWNAKAKSPPWLACVGAMTTLLLLGFEPFTQQVIEFPTRHNFIHNKTGSVSYTHALLDSSVNATLRSRKSRGVFGMGLQGMVFDMPSAVPTNALCDTDDCSLPDFISLASCVTCESEELNLKSHQCEFSISSFDEIQTFDSFSEFLDAIQNSNRSLLPWWDGICRKERKEYPDFQVAFSESFLDGIPIDSTFNVPSMIENGDYLLGNQDDANRAAWMPNVTAPTALWVFVQHRNSATLNPIEKILSFTFVSMNPLASITTIAHGTNAIQSLVSGTINWCSFQFCAKHYQNVKVNSGLLKAHEAKTWFLKGPSNQSTSDSNAIFSLSGNGIPNSTTSFRVSRKARDSLILLTDMRALSDVYNTEDMTAGNWSTVFNATTSVLSTIIQSPSNPEHQIVTGSAWGQETYIHVRWVWLIMPLSTVVLSATFLMLAAIKSARKPYLFKTSLLAILFHGLEGWKADELRWNDNVKEQKTGWDLLKVAAGKKARFERNVDGDFRIVKAD